MAAALREGGLLDSEGYLKRDPRASEWRDALRRKRAAPRFDALVPDQSATEALNVAFAAHALSSDKFDEDVRWLEERAADRRGEAPGAVAGAQTGLDVVKADAGETGGGRGTGRGRRCGGGDDDDDDDDGRAMNETTA